MSSTEIDSESHPTSNPILPPPHGQEEGNACDWCVGFNPTADLSNLCTTCRELDEKMPSIIASPAGTDEKIQPSIAGSASSARSRNNQQYQSVCPDHNTGKPRSYCIDCQIAGTWGGGLCKGGHGKRKNNCKECHPDENAVARRKANERYHRKYKTIDYCPEHDTGKRITYCIDCQKAGTGGGGLCKGGHGKEKRYCKECHPDIYEASRVKRIQKRKSSGPPNILNNVNEGKILKHFGSLENDLTECSCGNNIKNPEDPLCYECAAKLSEILE